jgi:hypothetical protein
VLKGKELLRMNGIFWVVYFLVIIAAYVFVAYCLQAIAKKFNIENDWFAYVPFLNFWLMVKIAGRDVVWFILLLIPCVNIIALIIIYMDIAEKCGKTRAYGLLMLIPIVNFFILWQLAFGT